MEELSKLQESAKSASKRAYAEFSKFKLGAALLTSRGKIFTGVNVENSSYGLTMCAERSAFFAAITAGEREFVAMAIYCETDLSFSPCGACRQVMVEFCRADFIVVYSNKAGRRVQTTLHELLPQSFKL